MNEGADEFSEAFGRNVSGGVLSCDLQEHKGDQGCKDLQANGVFIVGDELFDIEILFEPFEEQFNLPTGFVECCDGVSA